MSYFVSFWLFIVDYVPPLYFNEMSPIELVRL